MLRQRHNLVLVLGTRKDSRQMDRQQREVFQQIFELVDRYDLYGSVAYPKQHRRDQVPAIYRWAAARQGLFVNPALTEPFGLTLLEAAASGLPMVATDDGGPREILRRCDNGLLVDVTDLESVQDGLERAGADRNRWRRWSDNGVEAVSRHYSWDAHVCSYMALMQERLKRSNAMTATSQLIQQDSSLSPLGSRLLLLDLDSSLEQPAAEDLQTLRQQLNAPAAQALAPGWESSPVVPWPQPVNASRSCTSRILRSGSPRREHRFITARSRWLIVSGKPRSASIGRVWRSSRSSLIWPITWSFRNLSIRGNSRSVFSCVSPAPSVLP